MEAWYRERLVELAGSGLLRIPGRAFERGDADLEQPLLDACSNDYLGLGAVAVSRETLEALAGARAGAAASRLVHGTFVEHEAVEQELADWVGFPESLLTLSAFAANAGAIPALAGAESLLVSDALNHASIVDGCRLARANLVVTPHLDVDAVETALRERSSSAPAWVITEGLFSMDGDCPDLPALRAVCDRYEAGLLVDEAHSLGVLGPDGSGLAAALGVRADVVVAGLGKAVGCQGGFLASSSRLRSWFWNRARSFVFSTATSPVLARLQLRQVRAARAANAARERLASRGLELRAELAGRGLPLAGAASGPIVPVILGSNERALKAMAILR
jgi:8-amino-7-oxononanoate synthase